MTNKSKDTYNFSSQHDDEKSTHTATNIKTGETVDIPSDGTPVSIGAEHFSDVMVKNKNPNPASGTIEINKPDTRGGVRKGAGRPVSTLPKGEKKSQVAIYLKNRIIAGIKAITKDRSSYISDLVEDDFKRRDKS